MLKCQLFVMNIFFPPLIYTLTCTMQLQNKLKHLREKIEKLTWLYKYLMAAPLTFITVSVFSQSFWVRVHQCGTKKHSKSDCEAISCAQSSSASNPIRHLRGDLISGWAIPKPEFYLGDAHSFVDLGIRIG